MIKLCSPFWAIPSPPKNDINNINHKVEDLPPPRAVVPKIPLYVEGNVLPKIPWYGKIIDHIWNP